MGNNKKFKPQDETGLFGQEVLVPSTALQALEDVHGPDKMLHGKVKVRGWPASNCFAERTGTAQPCWSQASETARLNITPKTRILCEMGPLNPLACTCKLLLHIL